MNKPVIIDASVLITAIIGKNAHIQVRLQHLLREQPSLVHVLPFTIVEFANGVRFSTRDIPTAIHAIERFTALALPVIELAPVDIHAITKLSYQLNTTVYDTSYHYGALMHEGVFITCDSGYFKKSSRLGHIELWG